MFRQYISRTLLPAGLLSLLVGCIISGQFTILINIDDEIAYIDDVLNYTEVNLTTDETWDEHQEDIQNIVDVKFEMTIQNLTGSAVTGEVYVSKAEYTNVDDVTDNATLVLSGISVNANASREISFTESATFITNLDKLLELVEGGQFFIYGIAKAPPYTIRILAGSRLLVTFSAGT